MEFHIPDLLDGLQENSIDIQTVDIASPNRIRELTMQKIHTQKKRSLPGRRLFLLAAAIILVMGLAVTATAEALGASDWFGSLFGELSPEQEQVLDGLAQKETESVVSTVGDSSITLVSAMGDAYNCYARLRFTAPAGVNASGTPITDYFIYNMDYLLSDGPLDLLSRPLPEGEATMDYAYRFTWEDTVPNDNIVDAILHITLEDFSDLRFNDDTPETITIPGLWHGSTTLLEGPFQLTISALGGESLVLPLTERATTHKTDDGETEILLNQVIVSQLGIEVDASFSTPLTGLANFTYPTATAVLTDGTVAAAHMPGFGYTNTLTSESCHYKLYFDAPLELSDIDHIRFCGLILPVSGDGTVEPKEALPEYTIGTHVTLGDPDSLRLSAEVQALDFDVSTLTSAQESNLSNDERRAVREYAEYTDEGIRLYNFSVLYGEGRLSTTVTNARIVRDMAELNYDYSGFEYGCYLKPGENGWEEQEFPVGINPDGTFQEDAFLVVVDLTVENQNVLVSETNWSPNQTAAAQFNTSGLLFLVTLDSKDGGNLTYRNSDYFTEETGGWVNYFDLAPGETKHVTVGWFFSQSHYSGADWTTETIRACNTSGNEHSVFIDLNLP